MFNFSKLKKAFTLLELTIVIALVSIVGAAVVSLCVLVSNTAHNNSTRLAFMQEANLVQTLVQNYADENTDSLNQGGNITFPYDDQTKTFKFNGKDYTFDTIESINLTVKTNGNDFLIICNLKLNGSYTINNSDVFTFTVNPYVGESA